MRRKAGSLVGLEHAVAESVLLGQCEVGLNVGWIDVHELGVGMRIGRAVGGGSARDQTRPVHFASVVHGNKGGMGVAEIVILRIGAVCPQVDGTERNGLAQRVAVLDNIRAPVDQHRILEKIIRSAVLLDYHHHVLNLSHHRWRRRTATAAAAVETYESASRGQKQDCEY